MIYKKRLQERDERLEILFLDSCSDNFLVECADSNVIRYKIIFSPPILHIQLIIPNYLNNSFNFHPFTDYQKIISGNILINV